MPKRRTLRHKLKAQQHPVDTGARRVKTDSKQESHFRNDLVKSLVIISMMFALEFAWWFYSSRP